MSDGWEYGFAQVESNALDALGEKLNDLGAEGWEAVSLDRSASVVLMKRPLVPLPPPGDTSEGWKDDPSGRFDKRHWTSSAWSWHVARASDKSVLRDRPTY